LNSSKKAAEAAKTLTLRGRRSIMKALEQTSQMDVYDLLFENSKALLRPKDVSEILGISTKTVYDWKYRRKRRQIPEQLFLKLNGQLFIRTDILKGWFASENSKSS
jgi:predicted DNA-binding transcriptional regulator AlpA